MTRPSKRVLVIEDDALVAMLIEDILADYGCQAVASAGNSAQALAMAELAEVDFAVLDVNLGDGQTSFPAARALQARGVPLIWITGYGAPGVPAEFAHAPILSKPVDPALLAEAIRALG